MSCGTLIGVDKGFSGLKLPAEKAEGYRVVKRQVTFFGYCPECGDGRPGETPGEREAQRPFLDEGGGKETQIRCTVGLHP